MGEAGAKRLVLLVEGEGDAAAAPILVKKLLTDQAGWDCLRLDPTPIRIGGLSRLTGQVSRDNWTRFLKYGGNRPGTTAILALLDGDADTIEGSRLCIPDVARLLSGRAKEVGAGATFSLACVLACREFESWLIAGVESLAGRALPDGREGIRDGSSSEHLKTELTPRDAKGWLRKQMVNGYSPSTDQAALTSMVSLDLLRKRNLRSFRRLENALAQLIDAVRTNRPILTPQ